MAMAAKQNSKATRANRRGLRDTKQPGLPLTPAKELLLLDEVTARVRLSDTTLWRLEKVHRFPKRVKIGFKRVAWRAGEIDAWIAIGADAWAASHKAAAA
jgi:prophage regulatory protein